MRGPGLAHDLRQVVGKANVLDSGVNLRLYGCRGAIGIAAHPGAYRPVVSSSLARPAHTYRPAPAPVAHPRKRPFKLLFELALAAAARRCTAETRRCA